MDRRSFLLFVLAVLLVKAPEAPSGGLPRLVARISQKPLAVPAFTVQNGGASSCVTRRPTTVDRAEIGRISPPLGESRRQHLAHSPREVRTREADDSSRDAPPSRNLLPDKPPFRPQAPKHRPPLPTANPPLVSSTPRPPARPSSPALQAAKPTKPFSFTPVSRANFPFLSTTYAKSISDSTPSPCY